MHSPDLLGPVVLNAPTTDRQALRQLGTLLADVPRERPTLGLVVARDYAACGPRRFLATFRHVLNDPIAPKLRHVHTPAVVAWGTRDPLASPAWAREVASLLPDGRLAVVPGQPHALNYSAPGHLAHITLALLAMTSAT
jgi:pimeloyl-ACP methyl ester carboxylesterase